VKTSPRAEKGQVEHFKDVGEESSENIYLQQVPKKLVD
jgi:hypothetical protein